MCLGAPGPLYFAPTLPTPAHLTNPFAYMVLLKHCTKPFTPTTMAFLSYSRRHSPHLLRLLSTTPASAATVTISSSAAKNKLLNVFDPDESLAILASASPSSSSSSHRFALDLAVRRLASVRRFSDIESLLSARRSLLPAADEASLSSLILTYATANMLSHARQLFDEIPEKTSLSFNALLRAYAKAKKPKLIPELFSSLQALHPSIVPDHVSYGILIKSFCIVGKLNNARQVFDEMLPKGIEPTVAIYTTLLDSMYKKGKAEEAERLWSEMLAKGLKPDHVAYNVRMMYVGLHGKPEEVLAMIKEMEEAGWKPDALTYNYLISCYCRNKRFEDAKEAYRGFMKKKGSYGGPNAAIFKDLVNFLCGNGDFDGGLEVVRDSIKHNKIPDFKTMKVLVEGLMENGKVEEVKEVIRVVKERFPENLLGGWKSLEKKMGLIADGEVAEPVEVTEPVKAAEPIMAA